MKRDYEADAAVVLSQLKQGKENAVKRSVLVDLFGGSDSRMRKAVAYTRLKYGVNICNDQDGTVYFIGTTYDELFRQYCQAEARGKKILASLKALRKEMEAIRNKDQLTLSDIEKELEKETPEI